MLPFDLSRRPPIVSDEDRAWAVSKCPDWMRGARVEAAPEPETFEDEIHDDGAPLDLEPEDRPRVLVLRKTTAKGYGAVDGSVVYPAGEIVIGDRYAAPHAAQLVDEQARTFEQYYGGSFAKSAYWSAKWRNEWWPQVDYERRYPHSRPLFVSSAGYVFLRRGTPIHAIALAYATSPAERRVWAAHGVQFAGDSPILAQICAEYAATSRKAA